MINMSIGQKKKERKIGAQSVKGMFLKLWKTFA